MSAKHDLTRVIDSLSEYECQHLSRLVGNLAAGERFWEGDVAVFYNEYVKMRSSVVSHDPSSFVSTAPMHQEGIFAPIPLIKAYPSATRIDLPQPSNIPVSLSEVLIQRRSTRRYTDQPLSLFELATLLQHGAGVTGSAAAYDFRKLPLRTFPSAGALQAPEVYCFTRAVVDVPQGLHHYNCIDNVLETLIAKDKALWPTLCAAVPGQPYIASAAAVFVITGYYERLRWKYGSRGYRYMCMDVGFVAANLHLAGQGMSVGICAVAGFLDDVLEGLLGVDGEDEMPLLLVTVGHVKPRSNISDLESH
jgi:SagB-type dehydrogenase family enzyme